ncbi:Immunoglobulin-like domain,Immunoglobulin-like fold [Cinara cedri]|uniref:Immunoglobulin-like domain,Immunoglobulin-like fold n=1 Tax=Cinara cedri TaxID=506608 RepID=A0A5E4MGD6_9HEMI|nr:Immunoglobulin-like domain,Immunoglobulin-like fold [Cinara cedri]
MIPTRTLFYGVQMLLAVASAEILKPSWHQYYPGRHAYGIRYFEKLASLRENFQKGVVVPHSKWGFYNRMDTISSTTRTTDKKTRRLRVGSGWWKLVPPTGAEINCEFPSSIPVISNVVWERVDPGKADKEKAMRRMGEVQTYDMHLRPRGSTLHLHDVSQLDKGLYRCLASSVNKLTGEPQTVFQDTNFYPAVV